MFEFLNLKLIPKRITAKIVFPKEVVSIVEQMKLNKENINDESSFIRIEGINTSFHSGFVDLCNGKTIELEYSTEGNWFGIDVKELNKLHKSRHYYYNFEKNYIKPQFLETIKILEFGFFNAKKDGVDIKRKFFFDKEEIFILKLKFKGSKNLVINIKKPSIDNVIKVIDMYKIEYPELKIEDIDFTNDFFSKDYKQLIENRKINGVIKINNDRTFIKDYTGGENIIEFTIEAKTIF